MEGSTTNARLCINTSGKVTFGLNNVSIMNANSPAILGIQSDEIIIDVLAGTTTTLEDSDVYDTNIDALGTVFSNDTITLTGTGAFNIIDHHKNGIISGNSLHMNQGDVRVQAVKDALYAKDTIHIMDGSLKVIVVSDAIATEADVIIDARN